MTDTFFITTPIYYINATPHIGHAYTTIAADARARFERLRGKRVFFLTGTDEHGSKVARAAQDANVSPQDYADEISGKFRDCWDKLHIQFDDFVRTTQPRHEIAAKRIIEKLWESGHLTLGTYSGWYSVPDETFFKPEDVVERDGATYLANPTIDQTKAPLEWVEETTHFFRLSAFQETLIAYYEANPEVLQPTSRRNETLSFLRSGLSDVSISRELEWGIALPETLPGFEKHSIYVWFEALMNYVSAPGFLSDDAENRAHFDDFWPCDLHLMAKDIFTRFHATIWPAMLLALNLPLPRQLFAHGFWTVDGRKMGKRDPETIVDPVQFAQEIADGAQSELGVGVDALRYYCLREVTFGSDGDFSRDGCFSRYNSDLANGLGNLVNRALSMTHQYFEGVVPDAEDRVLDLWNAAKNATPRIENAYEKLEFHHALSEINEIVSHGNRVIEEQKPWAKIKSWRENGDGASRAEVAALLRELLQTCAWCSVMIEPVMPHIARKLRNLLGLEKLDWSGASRDDIFAIGHVCDAPQPLFPRLQLKAAANKIAANKTAPPQAQTPKLKSSNTVKGKAMNQPNQSDDKNEVQSREMRVEANIHNVRTNGGDVSNNVETTPQNAAESAAVPANDPSKKATIEYEDFAKIELRAARVLEAERIPKADKLLKLQVDLGTEKRQILAGIAQQFEPEQLVGKMIVVVANLAPRKMRGLDSEGMLLAASETFDGAPVGLLTIDADVAPGSIIR